MTLPSDFSALIAIAQADELDGIRRQILDRLDDLRMLEARELLIAVAARRKALAEERRKLQELWDATPAAAEEIGEGEEEAKDGG